MNNKQHHKKEIKFLILLLIIFFLVFIMSLVSLSENSSLLGLGIPYSVENWFFIILSILSIAKLVWMIFKYEME